MCVKLKQSILNRYLGIYLAAILISFEIRIFEFVIFYNIHFDINMNFVVQRQRDIDNIILFPTAILSFGCHLGFQ